MENEIWKDIPGYEGIYQASTYGRVKSVERIDCGGRHLKGKILTPCIVKGYVKVGLNYAGVNKSCSVHRLVASAFIPNPFQYEQINHKDENPLNNRVDNLEWCDYLYNRNYGHRNEKAARSQSLKLKGRVPHPEMMKPILKIDKNTNEAIEEFPSASEAARLCGTQESHISQVCNGYRRTAAGYKWKYV